MDSESYENTRKHSRITSVVSFVRQGLNLVFLVMVVSDLAHSLQHSSRLELKSPLELHSTDVRHIITTFVSSNMNFLIYSASSVPQLLGAGMLFIATGKSESPKEATELVYGHQKMQFLSLMLDLAGLGIFLASDMLEREFSNLESIVILIGLAMFSTISILIADRFRKELVDQ